ncbi:MAG: hypothetical protein MJY59_02440 [Bacteroidaceae bacterium]|nr:hypothetical protein [Bacteroidaceae bacterium]
MKKTYIQPTAKFFSISTESLLGSSPFPERIDFDPNDVVEEEDGMAD